MKRSEAVGPMDISGIHDVPPCGRNETRGVPSSSDSLFAALDLGTNSCRMFIAKPRDGNISIVDSFSRAVYLGQGLGKYGFLSRDAMSRALRALRVCRRKLDDHKVSKVRMVATEACRRARNGLQFIEKVRDETGLTLEVIDPREEARLVVMGIAPFVADDSDLLLVIDIGGGSTELVLIDFRNCFRRNRFEDVVRLDFGKCAVPGEGLGVDAERDVKQHSFARLVDWISVPYGVATLSARFSDVACESVRYALMSCCFEDEIAALEASVDLGVGDRFQIIGTSGTVTTIAASHLGLKRYERKKVHGLNLSAREIDAVVDGYIRNGHVAPRDLFRNSVHRRSLAMSGAAILQAIMRVWPSERLTVADCGLREGLLYSQMIAAGVIAWPASAT